MANKLPEFNETQPILQPRNLPDPAKGEDAFAAYLGKAAKDSLDKAKEMQDEQSNALAMQAQNSISDIATQSQIDLINNPNQSLKISNDSKNTINEIIQTTKINDKYRRQLERIANTYSNQITLDAVKTNHRQILLNTKTSLFTEAPQAALDISRLYQAGKIKEAELRHDTFTKTINDAFKIGAISHNDYQTLISANKSVLDDARETQILMGHKDVSAVDYQKNNNKMYGAINPNKASTPSSQYTVDNLNYHNEETTYQKATADVTQYARITNPQSYASLSATNKNKLQYLWEGANDAYANIMANTDYIKIENEFNDLKNRNVTGLSLTEEGKYKYYQNHFKRLENGESLAVMSETAEGQRIEQRYIAAKAAIEAAPLDDNVKQFRLKEIEDNKRQEYINLGFSMHMNPKYIKVVDKETLAPYEAGFQHGQDPNLIISHLRAADSNIKPYIADAMSKQHQAATLLLLGQAGDAIIQGQASDLIFANQNGADLNLIDIDRDAQSAKKIMGAIANDPRINSALMYYYKQPLDNAKDQDLPDGMIEALKNYVIRQAKNAGDFEVKNLPQYIRNAADLMQKSTKVYQDRNTLINNAQLGLADGDLKALGQYAIDTSLKTMRDQIKDDMEFYDLVDRQPYMLMNTANNVLVLVNSVTHNVALDIDGKPLFEMPYTDSIRQAARHHQQKIDLEKAKQFNSYKGRHPFGNTFK
jgi:hypothetical protein